MLGLTEEQEQLRLVLRDFFAAKVKEEHVRRLLDDPRGYDPEVWAQMSGQLGLPSLAVPEEFGGAGYGLREVGLAFEEAGRVLLPAPLLSGLLASQALLRSGDAQACADLLPALCSGESLATLAWLPETGRGTSTVQAVEGRLTGTLSFVLDAAVADVLLVVAQSPGGPSLYQVTGTDPGVVVEPLVTLDETRRQARVRLTRAEGRLVGQEGDGGRVLAQVLDVASAVLSAEQVGGAARALEQSVEYAKIREQFGRPIGSFQAVKHKCADMFVQLEAARAACQYALWAADEAVEEFPLAAAVAQSWCSEAYTSIATESIQVHGGIGFTWEHPAHLYYKRAKSSELLFGTPSEHRERIAQLVGL